MISTILIVIGASLIIGSVFLAINALIKSKPRKKINQPAKLKVLCPKCGATMLCVKKKRIYKGRREDYTCIKGCQIGDEVIKIKIVKVD